MQWNDVYLIRHGENPANLTKEFSCRVVDYSLTPKGILQAQQTGLCFSKLGLTFQGLYASPLKRAAETAGYIGAALGIPPVVMENFREVQAGDLELTPPTAETWRLNNEITLGWLHGKEDVRFPGGENYVELRDRMVAGLRRILRGRSAERLIVVGHGGIFSFTLKDLVPGADLKALLGQENHNCSISHLRMRLEGDHLECELVSWADIAHLSGPAAQVVSAVPKEGEL